MATAIATPLKLQLQHAAMPLIDHVGMEYMDTFTTPSTLIAYIKDAFTQEVFSPEQDAALKRAAHVQPLAEYLKALQQNAAITHHPNIEDLLETCPKLKNMYTVAEFIRSYIDFHHDFLQYAFDLIAPIKQRFEQQILPTFQAQKLVGPDGTITLKQWYNKWMNTVESQANGIYTASKNVSQTRCREILYDVISELLHYAKNPLNTECVIDWIPLTRAEAELAQPFMVRGKLEMGEKYSDVELTRLRALLNANGVSHCYAESFASGFYDPFLSESKKNIMRNVSMPIAEWDAGSGCAKRQHDVLHAYGESSVLSIFGGTATITADTDELKCTFSKNKHIKIEKMQRFGLNNTLKMIGYPPLRGEICEEDVRDITGVTYTPSNLNPSFAVILKTWTDFMQIRVLSHYHRPQNTKVAMCTSDICCEYTARMYGTPFVLLSSRNAVSVACYDVHALTIHRAEQSQKRTETLSTVLSYKNELNAFLKTWFDTKQDLLKNIKKHTVVPALFFAITEFETALDRYRGEATTEMQTLYALITTKTHEKDIRLVLPTFPTSLEEWFHRVTNSNNIRIAFHDTYSKMQHTVQQIKSLSRLSIKSWLTLFEDVEQMIVNSSAVTMTPLTLQMYVLTVFIVAYMEKGHISHTLQFLRNLQKKILESALMKIKEGKYPLESFVSVNTMKSVFVPPEAPPRRNVIKTLKKEWELRLCATLLAMRGDWRRHGWTGKFAGISDAMDVYNAILQNDIVAHVMVQSLQIGAILLAMADNVQPFNFEETQLIESSQNSVNNATTFTSWASLWNPSAPYTLSMIDPKNTFSGLADRVEAYIKDILQFKLSTQPVELELSHLIIDRTRHIYDPAPRTGLTRYVTKPYTPVKTSLYTLYGIENSQPNARSNRTMRKRKANTNEPNRNSNSNSNSNNNKNTKNGGTRRRKHTSK